MEEAPPTRALESWIKSVTGTMFRRWNAFLLLLPEQLHFPFLYLPQMKQEQSSQSKVKYGIMWYWSTVQLHGWCVWDFTEAVTHFHKSASAYGPACFPHHLLLLFIFCIIHSISVGIFLNWCLPRPFYHSMILWILYGENCFVVCWTANCFTFQEYVLSR